MAEEEEVDVGFCSVKNTGFDSPKPCLVILFLLIFRAEGIWPRASTKFSNIEANCWKPGFIGYLQLQRADLVPANASGLLTLEVMTFPCLLAWLFIKTLQVCARSPSFADVKNRKLPVTHHHPMKSRAMTFSLVF